MFNALESLPVTATVLVILIAVAVFASHEAGIDFVIVEPLSVMVGSELAFLDGSPSASTDRTKPRN